MRPPAGATREQFAAVLAEARTRSHKSYATLARVLDRPRSTLHDWCSGTHLPFPRDDAVFERLLLEVGIEDPVPWLDTLRRLRRRSDGVPLNPYLGLRPFTEQDADRLFGRRAAIDRLRALVDQRAEIPCVVIGASGAGKTSLLRAGLLGRADPSTRGRYLTPGPQPLERLDALSTLDAEPGVRDLTVIDQFEELFTLASDAAGAAAIEMIATAAKRESHDVVLGVRADFYHRMLEVPLLAEAVTSRQLVLGPLSASELTEAIVEPAARAGITLSAELIAELVASVTRDLPTGSPLPLLSHVLYQLAERAAGTHLGLEDYDAIGGISHALERSAEDAYLALCDAERHTCQALFAGLIELGHDARPTQRPLARQLISNDGNGADGLTDPPTSPLTSRVIDRVIDRVIEAFVARRLLTVDRDTVRLSHEALITAWPRLAGWVEDWREAFRIDRRVRLAYGTWLETNHDHAALLRGGLLDEANSLLEHSIGAPPDPGLRRFVEHSRAQRAREQREDAERLARQLAMQSSVLDHLDPSLAGHLAMIAQSVAVTAETRSAVLRSAASVAGPRFVGPNGAVHLTAATGAEMAVIVHPRDQRVLRVGLDGQMPVRIETWTSETFADASKAAIPADASHLAIATGSGDVVIMRIGGSGPKVRLPAANHGAASVSALTFDGTGDLLVAGTTEGIILQWRRCGSRWSQTETTDRHATVIDLDLHPIDGSVLVALADGRVEWHGDLGTVRWSTQGSVWTAASTVKFAPDGSHLAAGFHDGRVRIWSVPEAATGSACGGGPTEIPIASAPFASWVNAVCFSPDGSVLAAASSDGTVRLWSTDTWQELRPELRHPAVVSRVRFLSPHVLMSASEDGIVRSWDLSRFITGSDDSIWALGLDGSGERLMAASRSLVTFESRASDHHRWHLEAPVAGEEFSGAAAMIGDSVALGTRGGSILLAVPDAAEAPIMIGEPQVLGTLVEGVAVDPGGTTVIAVAANGHAGGWWLDADHRVLDGCSLTVSAGSALGVAIDRRRIAAIATEPGEVVLVDLSSPGVMTEHCRFVPGDGFPISVHHHPRARLLAIGGSDRSVSLWDITDPTRPRLRHRLHGPGGHVMAVRFDSLGGCLAAGVTDGSIWLWDLDETAAAEIAATDRAMITTGEAGVYALAFTPDDRQLISAGPRRRIIWWPLDDEEAGQMLARRCGDGLTEAERRRYVPDSVAAPNRR